MSTSLIDRFDMSREHVETLLGDALRGADDGELYLEYREQESLVFDNGRLKAGNFSTDQGFGMRAVSGEVVGFAHSGEFTGSALKRAAEAVSTARDGHAAQMAEAPAGTNRRLYGDENPIPSPSFEEKVRLLGEIDAYLRGKDPTVRLSLIHI